MLDMLGDLGGLGFDDLGWFGVCGSKEPDSLQLRSEAVVTRGPMIKYCSPVIHVIQTWQ